MLYACFQTNNLNKNTYSNCWSSHVDVKGTANKKSHSGCESGVCFHDLTKKIQKKILINNFFFFSIANLCKKKDHIPEAVAFQ